MQRRREFEEKLSMSEALVARLEGERDEARATIARAEQRLLDAAPDVVAAVDALRKGWLSSSEADRAERLREHIRGTFKDVREGTSDDSAGGAAGGGGARPAMV
jgi:multidrug resistance efflux pump